MSSTTWTPTAVASEAFAGQAHLWRAVEAKHRVSTLALVDTLQEQAELEALLDESKPQLPKPARNLHFLLFTPFRYPPLHFGSRFRAPYDPGVFYGADEVRTACAELGYWRWRFVRESHGLSQIRSVPQTIFRAHIATRVIDLRRAPFERDRALWTDPDDYAACHRLAACAREARLGAILYESVRDPERGGCTAVLTANAFSSEALIDQTWLLSVTAKKVFWHRDSPIHRDTFEFDMARWQ